MQGVNSLQNATQRTILFLIADTGAGHRSAANAISNALKIIAQREQEEWQTTHASNAANATNKAAQAGEAAQALSVVTSAPPPTYRIEIVDVFEEYSRFPLREAVKLYGPTIRYNPKLYGEVFHKMDREETVLRVQTLAIPLILNGLMRLFTTVKPDIIVSIHPMVNFVTVRALRELGIHIPFITVVTDLISIHNFWFAPGVDAYIVPTEQAKQRYLRRGLDPQRVHLIGMPIDPKFAKPTDSKEELRKRLGLKPGIPTILLVGGGDGAGGLQRAVRAISQARLSVQLLVVTGRNRRLYAQLQRSRSNLHVPAQVFGFVQNMPELMRAADIIVTKAGPGTICEALACNLPIVISGYVPGQEEGNVEFVVKNKVGALALESTTLIDILRRLLKPGSQELRQWTANAQRISQSTASFDIAYCIIEHMESGSGQQAWNSTQWQKRKRMMSGRLRSAIRIRPLQTRLPRPFLKSPVLSRLKGPGLRQKRNEHRPGRD
jgi:1,2-diacylglycerol 3-beta-galactosyltransferase